MINVVIFDFDGVLVESVDIKTKGFAGMFEQEGMDVVKKIVDFHLNNTGVSRYEKFKYFYKEILKRPLGDHKFQMLCKKFSEIVVDEVVKAPYVKGAEEFLNNYATEYKCFVVTATPQEEIEKIINKRNITHFFEEVYGAPVKKSDAVRKILKKEKIQSNKVVFIGDAMSDFNAARQNSVNFIGRLHNYDIVFKEKDCWKVRDLTELRSIIEQL